MELEKKVGNGLIFIKEVAKYFMDFLETDFHKRKNPKRSIQLRNASNLLVGLNLNKYPTFSGLVWKAINHAFDKGNLDAIQKGVYRTNIPKNLLDLVELSLSKITDKQVKQLLKQISEEIEKASTLYKKEYDQALTASIEASTKIIQKNFVLPFIAYLEKPLENLNLGDEDSVYTSTAESPHVVCNFMRPQILIFFLFLKDLKLEIYLPKFMSWKETRQFWINKNFISTFVISLLIRQSIQFSIYHFP